jgi:hypothetical protein
MNRLIALVILFVLLSMSAMALAHGPVKPYQLPLVGAYGMTVSDQRTMLADLSELGGSTIVDDVAEVVAVDDRYIVGSATEGFFLFDTTTPRDDVRIFSTQADFTAALSAAGIVTPVTLRAPDDIAAVLPNTTLYPWHYRVMQNRSGMSDSAWAVVFQALGGVVSLFYGWFRFPREPSTGVAIAIGLVVNGVSMIYLTGGGGGAFVGFVLFPLLAIGLAKVGNAAANMLPSKRKDGGLDATDQRHSRCLGLVRAGACGGRSDQRIWQCDRSRERWFVLAHLPGGTVVPEGRDRCVRLRSDAGYARLPTRLGDAAAGR